VFFANLPWAQNHESGAALAGKFVPFFALFRRLSAWPAGQSPPMTAIMVTMTSDAEKVR